MANRVNTETKSLQGRRSQEWCGAFRGKYYQNDKFMPVQTNTGLTHWVIYDLVIGQLKPADILLLYTEPGYHVDWESSVGGSSVHQDVQFDRLSFGKIAGLNRY